MLKWALKPKFMEKSSLLKIIEWYLKIIHYIFIIILRYAHLWNNIEENKRSCFDAMKNKRGDGESNNSLAKIVFHLSRSPSLSLSFSSLMP